MPSCPRCSSTELHAERTSWFRTAYVCLVCDFAWGITVRLDEDLDDETAEHWLALAREYDCA